MTNRLSYLFAVAALLMIPVPSLLAQGKDMGQAQQFYKPKKFHFTHAKANTDGTVKWHVADGGKQEMVKDEYVILEGSVEVFYQDIKITADKITANLKTKDVVAEGHVILDQGATRISSERAFFNLDSRTGTFFNATGTFEPSISFTGEKMEKTAEKTYLITNGVFTSCDLDRPAWSFHVQSGLITLDDYAHFKGLELKVHNLPIFWTPYLLWPTKKDRAQGFMIPRVRISRTFGERLELGYFVPFGDSADLTVLTDLNTKGYFGAGVDLRYVPTPNVKIGELNAYAVHDPEGKTQQWKYSFKHAQDELPFHFRGVVDIQDFSNLDFFRKYDSDPRLNTLSNVYSSAYLTSNRQNFSMNILADRRDIFLTTTTRQRFEQEPSLQFRLYPDRIGQTPFYLSIESSASHLRTTGLINGPEADYYRADIYPTLSMQIHTAPWFSIKPQFSLRQTWYSASLTDTSVQSPGQLQTAVDQSVSRFYGQGQVEIVGPSFARVFNEDFGGFSKFKHVIEPRFRYLYTTDVNNENRLIRFDSVDSPFLPIVRDSVEYSLTQRIIGKEKGPNASSRELLSFSVLQTVSLSKPLTSLTASSPLLSSTGDNKFSPLTANLHFNPYQSISLDANSTFGNVSHQLDQSSISANLVAKNRYLGFTWFATYLQPGQTAGTDNSQLRVSAGLPVFNDKIRADIQINYDAKKNSFLEQRYLIGGNGSCYSVAVEYRRFFVYDINGPRTIRNFDIAVTLKNVGTISAH